MIEPTLKDKILDAAWQFDWTVQPEKSDEFRVVSLSRPGPKVVTSFYNNNNKKKKSSSSNNDDNDNSQHMDIYLDTMVVGICPNFALWGRSMMFLTDMSGEDTILGMMKKTPTQLESSILDMVGSSNKNKKEHSSKKNGKYNNNNNNNKKTTIWEHQTNNQQDQPMKTTMTMAVFHRHVCDFGWKQPVLKKRQWKVCSALLNDEDARLHFMEGFGGAVPGKTSLVELGTTWVVITPDGTSRFGGRCVKNDSTFPELPNVLRRQLHGRQRFKPFTTCLALSPDGTSYFCQFADGSFMTHGLPEELTTAMKDKSYLHGRGSHQSLVKSLALGPDDSYVCIWEDGSYNWSGVEDDLHAMLMKGTAGIDIGFKDVSDRNNGSGSGNGSGGGEDNGGGLSPCQIKIGSNNEWFIRYVGGAWSVSRHTDECEQAIETVKNEEDGMIVDIHFGNDGMWLIEYEVGEDVGSQW